MGQRSLFIGVSVRARLVYFNWFIKTPDMNKWNRNEGHGNVKSFVVLLLGSLLLAGCATSTIESRKQERPAAYDALSPEQKKLVDNGQIKVGMSQDAVYLAWGRPADVLQNETQQGKSTIWLYTGTVMQESRFWTYREISRDGTTFLERFPEREYYPQDYVRAEIVFVDGKVSSWRTLPRPL